ncbi:MAG: hypothetical protein Fur0035_05270 [Anaerolineales bacterium]
MKKIFFSFFSKIAQFLPLPIKQGLYRFSPLARMLRGALNASVEDGLATVEVSGGDLRGWKVLINLKTEKSRWLGTYEPELQAAIRDLIAPGATVYDVGANIGYVSLLLAKRVGPAGRVFAFEPLPANLERIRQNVALNQLNNVTVVPAAVTDQNGEVTFYVHDSVGMGKAAGSAGRSNSVYRAEIRVAALSLDEFIFGQGNPPPQVVKMDIEGGEVLALPGMKRALETHHPLMLLELHGPESEQAAWQALSGAGYRLSAMRPAYPPIHSATELGWKAYLIARHD